jgi:hypothetical protein
MDANVARVHVELYKEIKKVWNLVENTIIIFI